jgi:hypothetical protein
MKLYQSYPSFLATMFDSPNARWGGRALGPWPTVGSVGFGSQGLKKTQKNTIQMWVNIPAPWSIWDRSDRSERSERGFSLPVFSIDDVTCDPQGFPHGGTLQSLG